MMARIAVLLSACLLVLGFAGAVAEEPAPDHSGTAIMFDVKGAIGPATTNYLRQGFASAEAASLIIVRIDTPGGLVDSMREIIQMFLASPVPVIAYVAPGGARAASAGTYMLYASHLAAMAPGTNLGAATPVQLGSPPRPLDRGQGQSDSADQPAPADTPEDTMTAKTVNDAVAYIRALADLQGRNADWAEDAVRNAASLSANEALKLGVIEIIASDPADLLAQADGRHINLGGQPVILHTGNLEIVEMPPDWRSALLGVLANPTLAYLLMLIGIYGLLFEAINPGGLAPGVLGAVSLILALFALNMLPLNTAGMGLVLLGIALMTAEAFAPSFGVLGIGGILAFGLGSLLMFEKVPGFHLSPGVVIAATFASALLLIVVLAAVIRAHRHRVVTGDAAMIDAEGTVLAWSGKAGTVLVHGERWQALAKAPAEPGTTVRVTARDGLTLTVEPVLSTKEQ